MIDSEYDITPVNNECSQQTNETVIVSSKGSNISHTSNNIRSIHNQHIENSKYDTVSENIQPLYGGKNSNHNLYKIHFRKKIIKVYALNERNAIKTFLKNKIYKKETFLEIYNNNNKSTYLIKYDEKNNKNRIYKK
jgi:hypothetical protein